MKKILFLMLILGCQIHKTDMKPSAVLKEKIPEIQTKQVELKKTLNAEQKRTESFVKEQKILIKEIKDPELKEKFTESLELYSKDTSVNYSLIFQQANTLESLVSTVGDILPEVKRSEDKNEESSQIVQAKLLAFSGIAVALAGLCALLYFLITPKHVEFLVGVFICAGLSISALLLREYWNEVLICGGIAIIIGAIVLGRKLYIKSKEANVNAEYVKLIDVIKNKLPTGLKEEIFGDDHSPVGIAYHMLSEDADKIADKVRNESPSTR